MRLYIPNNLDLAGKLNSLPNGEGWIKHILKLYYVMTVIYRYRWNKTAEKNDFAPLNARKLRTILGTRFAKQATELLTKLDIIETDNHYRVGSRSRGYRFKEPYLNTKFKEVKGIEYWQVSTNLQPNSQINLVTAAEQFLYENLKRVTLDEGVSKFLEQFQAKSGCQRDYYERSVEDIKLGEWFFGRDKKTGRVFSNITSLPRNLRPYLRLDGKPLVEIDVSNCQPLLLLGLYDDEPEREKFKLVVESGKFYEFLDNKLEKPFGLIRRDTLKKRALTQICFDRIRPEAGRLGRVFEDEFPALHQKILFLKRNDFRKLAHRLQSDEASIVIGNVVNIIAQTTRIPILTIHDSVLTLPEHAEEVMKRLEKAFFDALAVKAPLKVKNRNTDLASRTLQTPLGTKVSLN